MDISHEFNIEEMKANKDGTNNKEISFVKWCITFSIHENGSDIFESQHAGETFLSTPDAESFIEFEEVSNDQVEDWVVTEEGGKSFLNMLKRVAIQNYKRNKSINSSEVIYQTNPETTDLKANRELYKSAWQYVTLNVFKLPENTSVSLLPEVTTLGRTKSFNYVVSGSLVFENKNREPLTYKASDNMVSGGLAFPGKYKITALEDAVYKCVRFAGDLSMYEIQEIRIEKGQGKTVSQLWEKALVVRGAVSVDGEVVPENTFFEPAINSVITTGDSALILFTREKGTTNEALESDTI